MLYIFSIVPTAFSISLPFWHNSVEDGFAGDARDGCQFHHDVGRFKLLGRRRGGGGRGGGGGRRWMHCFKCFAVHFFAKPFDRHRSFENHVGATKVDNVPLLGNGTTHVQQQFAGLFAFGICFGYGSGVGGLEFPRSGQLSNELFASEERWESVDEDFACRDGNEDHVRGISARFTRIVRCFKMEKWGWGGLSCFCGRDGKEEVAEHENGKGDDEQFGSIPIDTHIHPNPQINRVRPKQDFNIFL